MSKQDNLSGYEADAVGVFKSLRRMCCGGDTCVVVQGYMRLKRGEGAKCNIGTEPQFPIKTTPNPKHRLSISGAESEGVHGLQ